MDDGLDKDTAILATLARLRAVLGAGAFDVTDHWAADLTAVGVASPRDHRVLVYIALYPDGYYAELESPAPPGEELPYRVAGRHAGLTFDRLVEVVAGHLAPPRTEV